MNQDGNVRPHLTHGEPRGDLSKLPTCLSVEVNEVSTSEAFLLVAISVCQEDGVKTLIANASSLYEARCKANIELTSRHLSSCQIPSRP